MQAQVLYVMQSKSWTGSFDFPCKKEGAMVAPSFLSPRMQPPAIGPTAKSVSDLK